MSGGDSRRSSFASKKTCDKKCEAVFGKKEIKTRNPAEDEQEDQLGKGTIAGGTGERQPR